MQPMPIPSDPWIFGFAVFFSQVDISLNGTQVTTSTNTYPYRAMIEQLLSYSDDSKMSQLTSSLFYKDQAGRMDVVDFGEAALNTGLWNWSRFTRGSRAVDMVGRIHADIFFQNRYLPNKVNVKIKLVMSRNSFCLMSANAFQAKINSAIMFVRKLNYHRRYFWLILKHWRIPQPSIPYVELSVKLSQFQIHFKTST